MDILRKMQQARETRLPLTDKIAITIRRPTGLMMDRAKQAIIAYQQTGDGVPLIQALMRYVVDWRGVKQRDLFPGGADEAVPFSAEVFADWFEDQNQHWGKLITAVVDAFVAYESASGEQEKN